MQAQADSETILRSEKKIAALEQQARNLAGSVETLRQQTLAQSNNRIEALEQKARDLAHLVETTRKQTLLQSDRKIEALEQKARELADFVESLRNQTRLQSEAEIETLGRQARDLALFVESVRKETRLKSELEIEALGKKARDLAISVETVRGETLLRSDTEIAALGQQARDLAVSVESVREETLFHSDNEIAALGQRARDLAVSMETARESTLLQSDTKIAALGKKARDLAVSVEESRIATLLYSDKVNAELERRDVDRTAELELSNRELLAANRELEAFSYSVSHDLRSPLRALDGFSDELLQKYGGQLDDQGRHYLRRVRAGTQRMGQLIDDLLKLSRLNRAELRHLPVDLTALSEAVFAELREREPGRSATFAAKPGLTATCDPALIRVVLENLLGNAWKFTSKNPTAAITFEKTDAAGRPAFVVRDDGAGFDMAYAGKLFGAFQRLHSDREFTGTGIGLATVQRIIRRHGGEIWAEGAVGGGAAFFFTLPGSEDAP